MEILCLLFLFSGVLSTTMTSEVKPMNEPDLVETPINLKDWKEEIERRVSSVEKKSLEQRNQLLEKIEEEEVKSRNRADDLSLKLQERISEQRDEVLKRVDDMEIRCEQSTLNVKENLQIAEKRLKKLDNHLLMEVLQLKPMLKEVVEKVRSMEEEFRSALERERLKTHSLQVQMTELIAELHSVDLIKKDVISLTDNLRQHLNERLTFGLETIQTNVTENMRVFENSSLKFSEDVSRLHENLKSLQKSSKTELVTLRSQLSPRFETLEGKSSRCDDVPEMKNTLTDHSSQLSRLNQRLWDVENTCAGEPPSTPNGKPLKFDRKPASVVQFECDRDFVPTGNSTVLCVNGRWEGQPPNCSFFDTTFILVVSYVDRKENITCYSDRHVQKIAFSRVVDTGTGTGLPNRASTRRDEGAVLDLTSVDSRVRTGAYECGIQVNDRSVRIVSPYNRLNGWIQFRYFSEVANIGDTVKLEVSTISVKGWSLRWRRNGVPLPSWDRRTKVEIRGVQPDDAGIYECYDEEERIPHQSLFRLIVRKCRKNRYGVSCEWECPACYNGGICHDLLGLCVCPAGFTGKNCEFACGENHVGADCAKLCTGSDCGYKIFCKPDPFGCGCFPGWKGFRCDVPCNAGKYGASCKQTCHCADGPWSCDRETGACSGGCSRGWSGQSCQIPV